MRAALRHLATLLMPRDEDDPHLIELLLVLVLIVIVTAMSFVFFGDAVADLISLIGGHVDKKTLAE